MVEIQNNFHTQLNILTYSQRFSDVYASNPNMALLPSDDLEHRQLSIFLGEGGWFEQKAYDSWTEAVHK